MNASQARLDSSLKDWRKIKDEFEGGGLLLGNGASRTVWDKFGYSSLYEAAQSVQMEHQLSPKDITIFKAMDNTEDFERVLAALWVTQTICNALNQDVEAVRERYESIQQALIETVKAVHVPWEYISDKVLPKLYSAILPYQVIYTTNYDLLLYWAIMTEYPPKFKDYFWSENDSFDIDYANLFHTEDRSILYLHGALHLVRSTLSGKTRKLTATSRNLLTQFGQSLNSGETPLFVTEGRPHDKLASIRSSDYLSFAYEQFANHEGNLVIFGHSLGDSDQHLINAMKHWVNRTIAVSMRPSANDPNRVIEYKAKIKRQLPQAHIIFYNAETHPLGKQGLRITRDGDNNI
jgi:hypothetical protein